MLDCTTSAGGYICDGGKGVQKARQEQLGSVTNPHHFCAS